jgi:hypothetical protein
VVVKWEFNIERLFRDGWNVGSVCKSFVQEFFNLGVNEGGGKKITIKMFDKKREFFMKFYVV